MAGGAQSSAPGTLAKPLLESQAGRPVAGRLLSGDSAAPRRQSSVVPASEEGTEYFTPRSELDLGLGPAGLAAAGAPPRPSPDGPVSRLLSSSPVCAVVLVTLGLFAAMAYHASEGPGRPALRWLLLAVVVLMAAGLCCVRRRQRPAPPALSPGRLPSGGGPRIIEEEPSMVFCGQLSARLAQVFRGDTRPFEVNSKEGAPVQGSGFHGKVLFLHLPDWDTAADPPATASAADVDNWHHHRASFEGRKRRFEFRLQGTFDLGEGEACEAFFCSQLPSEALSMDFWVRARRAVTAAPVAGIVNTLNSALGTGLQLNVEGAPQDDGSELLPCAVWPLLGADTLVRTPLGQEPPPLDSPRLGEHNVPRGDRGGLQLDSRHTYTFVFHSMYGDFVRRELNIMSGLGFSFDDYIGRSPVYMSVHRLKKTADADTSNCDLHRESNKDYVLSLELGPYGPGRPDAGAA